MQTLTPCKICGINEPDNLMRDGVCLECISEQKSLQIQKPRQQQFPEERDSTEAWNIITQWFSLPLRLLRIALFIFCIALCIKILVTAFDGKKVRYSFNDRTSNIPYPSTYDGTGPKLHPLNPTIYKMVGNSIISETGGFLDKLAAPSCTIMDLKNWECTWNEEYVDSDGSIKNWKYLEKMNDGDYTTYSTSWSLERLRAENEHNDVGAFRYHIVQCKWDFEDGFLNGMIMCPLRIAFHYP